MYILPYLGHYVASSIIRLDYNALRLGFSGLNELHQFYQDKKGEKKLVTFNLNARIPAYLVDTASKHYDAALLYHNTRLKPFNMSLLPIAPIISWLSSICMSYLPHRLALIIHYTWYTIVFFMSSCSYYYLGLEHCIHITIIAYTICFCFTLFLNILFYILHLWSRFNNSYHTMHAFPFIYICFFHMPICFTSVFILLLCIFYILFTFYIDYLRRWTIYISTHTILLCYLSASCFIPIHYQAAVLYALLLFLFTLTWLL